MQHSTAEASHEQEAESLSRRVTAINAPAAHDRQRQTKDRARLPRALNRHLGSQLGDDFSDVTVHTDHHAATMARRLGANAFTVGNRIYFAKGQYRPDSLAGTRLLAHELVHTRQQRGTTPRIMRQAAPCDAGHSASLTKAITLASQWCQSILGWLEHKKKYIQGLVTGGTVDNPAAVFELIQSIDAHFNLGSHFSYALPTSSDDVETHHVGGLVSVMDELHKAYGKLDFTASGQCDNACSDTQEGGNAVAGSGSFAICESVFDCQDEKGQAYIVFHEVAHASNENSDFDVYHTDDKYPPEFSKAIRNPDSLASFAYSLKNQGTIALSICFEEQPH